MIFKAIKDRRAARWIACEAQEISVLGNLGFEGAVLCKQYAALTLCGDVVLAQAKKDPYSRKDYERAARYFKTVLVEYSMGKREKRGDVSDLDNVNASVRKRALYGYRECANVLFEAVLTPEPYLFMAEHAPVAARFADEVIEEAEEKLSRMGYSSKVTLEPEIKAVKERLAEARKAGGKDKSLAELAVGPTFADKDQERLLEAFQKMSIPAVDEKPFDDETALFIANTFLNTDAPGAADALINVALAAHGGSTAEQVLVGAMHSKVFVDYAVRKMEIEGNSHEAIQRVVDHIADYDPEDRWLILGRLADKLPDGSFPQQTMKVTFDEFLKTKSERKKKERCLVVFKMLEKEREADNSFRRFLIERMGVCRPVRGAIVQSRAGEGPENR